MRLIYLFFFVSLSFADDLLKLSPADYDNFLFRDDKTAAQVVISKANPNSATIQTRFLVAFPAGNSGALAMFNLTKPNGNPLNPVIQLVDGSLKSIAKDNNFTGLIGQFTLDQDSYIMMPVMGSVRTLRDFSEAGVKHDEMVPTGFQQTPNSISFNYIFLDKETSMNFTLSTTNTDKFPLFDSPTGRTDLPAGTFDFEITFNIASLNPLPVDKLIRSERKDLLTNINAKTLAFLTYKDKFLAGGWHFLTYFGRDSLISTRLLLPILSSEATEAAMGAVFDRMNSENGELCHEETIGDYATYINQQNKQPQLGSTPFYDYKMMDTNFQLLPLLASYFLDETTGKDRATAFLANQKGSQTYQMLLEKNVNLVLGHAKKFADDPSTFANLVQIKQDQPVGNWRDSDTGLGYGRFPYDINVAMVPSYLETTASNYRKVWEDKALQFFFVKPKQPKDSLAKYLEKLSLPSTLYSVVDDVPATIHALSLKADGSPVVVMHSDISFNLMYHNALTTDYMRYVLDAMKPFPRGLMMDGVGLLIANPAYDYDNQTNWDTFSRKAYHGSCVWAFQQSMLLMGIDRQLNLCSLDTKPDWCNDQSVVSSLKLAQCNLWTVITQNPLAGTEETWSWDYDNDSSKFVIKTPSELSSKAMESDAVQLWSFVLLAANQPAGCPSTPTTTPKLGVTHLNLFVLCLVLIAEFFF
ncbi:unnamed protein product, partial [Mesorhabditis belari]|uniref:Uncharacterized protein n=1 Tax=Mesorhabditis belari TaxID=2138241 RepID=A0AAF3EP90_9BILA